MISLDQQVALRTAAADAWPESSTAPSTPRPSSGSCTPATTSSPTEPPCPTSCRCWPSGSPASGCTALARVEGTRDDGKPIVLFLCTHNAGRSQMALGFFSHLAGDRAVAWSGGSEPGIEINPAAVAAMAERGIDISAEFPKPWTDEIVRAADVVITMGCGDACPIFPGKRYEDWTLDDPAGQDVDDVRPVRDEIERRVRAARGARRSSPGTPCKVGQPVG